MRSTLNRLAIRDCWALIGGTVLFDTADAAGDFVCVAHKGEEIAPCYIEKYSNADFFFLR